MTIYSISVNMKRPACSGNVRHPPETVAEHVSRILVVPCLHPSIVVSSTVLRRAKKFVKYGMSPTMRKVLVVGGNGFVGLYPFFKSSVANVLTSPHNQSPVQARQSVERPCVTATRSPASGECKRVPTALCKRQADKTCTTARPDGRSRRRKAIRQRGPKR